MVWEIGLLLNFSIVVTSICWLGCPLYIYVDSTRLVSDVIDPDIDVTFDFVLLVFRSVQ